MNSRDTSTNSLYRFAQTRKADFVPPGPVFLLNPSNRAFIEGHSDRISSRINTSQIPLILGLSALFNIPSFFRLMTNRNASASDNNLTLLFLGAGLALTLVIFIVFIGMRYIRDSVLSKNGQLLDGELVKLEISKQLYIAHYEFITPDNEILQAVERRYTNDFENAVLPAENCPVIVLYENNRRFKML